MTLQGKLGHTRAVDYCVSSNIGFLSVCVGGGGGMEPDKIACSLALIQFRNSLPHAFTDACFYAVNRRNHAIFENGDQISMVDKVQCISQSYFHIPFTACCHRRVSCLVPTKCVGPQVNT